jgi:hypothetical protein
MPTTSGTAGCGTEPAGDGALWHEQMMKRHKDNGIRIRFFIFLSLFYFIGSRELLISWLDLLLFPNPKSQGKEVKQSAVSHADDAPQGSPG